MGNKISIATTATEGHEENTVSTKPRDLDLQLIVVTEDRLRLGCSKTGADSTVLVDPFGWQDETNSRLRRFEICKLGVGNCCPKRWALKPE